MSQAQFLYSQEIGFLRYNTLSGKEEDGGHNLQIEPLRSTTIDGQGCGGVQGHLHLPRRGACTLLGQALH